MKINFRKLNKIRQLLQDEFNDVEITDVEIVPTGYREYEVQGYSINLDAEEITKQIKKILEEE